MDDLISRQATARRLLNERKHYDCYRDIGIGLDIARMIVEDYCPTVQPEYRMDEWCTDCKEYDQEKHCCPRWNRVIRTTLQDAQRTGRWKVSDIPKGKMKYCSECGFGQYIQDERIYSYCPNCGAKMEVQE